ncbi:MAG: hypothetical protein JWP96_1207 [Polaromonas sp.]|nr:hypothetical protein [Polaromonas sp.]
MGFATKNLFDRQCKVALILTMDVQLAQKKTIANNPDYKLNLTSKYFKMLLFKNINDKKSKNLLL